MVDGDVELLLPTALRRLSGRLVRSLSQPSLDDFAKADPELSTRGRDLLRRIAGETPGGGSGDVPDFDADGPATPVAYPIDWQVEVEQAALLHRLVMWLKPATVVETGVADGGSSRVILQALRQNDKGRLVSFDIDQDVGGLIDVALRSRWELRVLPAERRSAQFQADMARLAPIDLFFHDSRHTYRWQMMEYRSAWSNMPRGAILASDDVDDSFAFLDFARTARARPMILVGARKVFGVLKKPNT